MKNRILLVEDEEISLSMLYEVLKDDYTVLTSTNGKEAFDLYKKFNPHVIVTDLKMPIMNGIELIRNVRKYDPNTKIIITTFKNDLETLLEATELKLFKYLIKPIDFKELKNTINSSIDEFNNYNFISVKSIRITEKLIWKRDDFELYYEGNILKLTPKEKKVLNILLSKPNKVFTYNELLYEAWEKDNEVGDRKTLKNIITGLRRKLIDSNINNVYGFGYKIEIPSFN